MSEIKRTQHVPASTRELISYSCDLCGAQTDESGLWQSEAHVARFEVSVESTKRTSSTTGGAIEGEAFDLCPDCFNSKVRPALLELGLRPRNVLITL